MLGSEDNQLEAKGGLWVWITADSGAAFLSYHTDYQIVNFLNTAVSSRYDIAVVCQTECD